MGDKFDKQSITEKKLLAEMVNLGLRPEPQYQISRMTVDFAFPNEMLVIEVNGPHHDTDEQKLIDKKRWFVLNNEGWKRRTYKADKVWKHTKFVAKTIKKELDKINGIVEHKPKPTIHGSSPVYYPPPKTKPIRPKPTPTPLIDWGTSNPKKPIKITEVIIVIIIIIILVVVLHNQITLENSKNIVDVENTPAYTQEFCDEECSNSCEIFTYMEGGKKITVKIRAIEVLSDACRCVCHDRVIIRRHGD